MTIDCDSCTARPRACGDCVMTFLTDPVRRPGAPVGGRAELDAAEREAIAVLAGSGLVPPLRLAN